jgi:hypothetical protein
MAISLQIALQTFVMETISNRDESKASRVQRRRKLENGIRYHSAVANLFGLSCFLLAASCALLLQFAVSVLERATPYSTDTLLFYSVPGIAGVVLALMVVLEIGVRSMFCQTKKTDKDLRPYPFGSVVDDPRHNDV